MLNRTLGEEAYITLKEWIISGRLSPGDRLMYDELGKQLGVSQTPLKEAFLRLEREGIVVILPRRGTFVRKLTRQDIIEFYQLREVLEGLSARLACEKATEQDVQELRNQCEILKAGIETEDAKVCLTADIEFHEKVVAIAGNSHLDNIMHTHVLTNLFAVTGRGEVYVENGRKALKQHQRVIDAIEIKDCNSAESAMREQICDGVAWILDSLEKNGNCGDEPESGEKSGEV